MDEDVIDGLLIDVRGEDLASLLIKAADSRIETALDQLLLTNAAVYNGFNSVI